MTDILMIMIYLNEVWTGWDVEALQAEIDSNLSANGYTHSQLAVSKGWVWRVSKVASSTRTQKFGLFAAALWNGYTLPWA